jgi:lipoprotein-anchoring transpeptidase ErfK/SrfK
MPHRVARIKQLLYERGYWITRIDSIRNSEYDFAISAFRKVEGIKQTRKFDDKQMQLLETSSRPEPRAAFLVYSQTDTVRAHIEVDLKRQVLFVIDSFGRVAHILPVSSGNGKLFTTQREDGTDNTRRALTPKGQYRITRKIDGWRKSELGMLYYPLYYRGGAAVHGANSVPDHPASHGCIRIPMLAAAEFSGMIPVGFPILVY